MAASVSHVRLGPPHSPWCQYLRDQIANNLGPEQQQQQQKEVNEKEQETELEVSNAYFDATIRILPIQEELAEENDNLESAAEDGIILVFDESDVDIENQLDQWHARAETIHRSSDTLRMMVGIDHTNANNTANANNNNQLTPQQLEARYAQRVLFGLDRGYEYVPLQVDGESMQIIVDDDMVNDDPHDKHGLARIVQALETTVWTSARMKPRKTNPNNITAPAKPLVTATSSSSDPNTDNVDDENDDGENAYIPPDPSLLLQSSALSTGASASATTTTPSAASPFAMPQQPPAEPPTPSEVQLQGLEHAVQQATRLREDARSGKFDNNDHERRQRAEQAALLLYQMMGMEDEEDDDDEEDNDDDDDDKDNGIEEGAADEKNENK